MNNNNTDNYNCDDQLTESDWQNDVVLCVSQISKNVFRLDDVYEFEELLSQKHPMNRNIRAKIRQQLQVMRDRGLIEFLDRGVYRKTGSLGGR